MFSVGRESIVISGESLPEASLAGVAALDRSDGTVQWEHQIEGFNVFPSTAPVLPGWPSTTQATQEAESSRSATYRVTRTSNDPANRDTRGRWNGSEYESRKGPITESQSEKQAHSTPIPY